MDILIRSMPIVIMVVTIKIISNSTKTIIMINNTEILKILIINKIRTRIKIQTRTTKTQTRTQTRTQIRTQTQTEVKTMVRIKI